MGLPSGAPTLSIWISYPVLTATQGSFPGSGNLTKTPELSLKWSSFQSALRMKSVNCFLLYQSKPIPPYDCSIPSTTVKPPGPACCQPSIVAPSKSGVKPGSTDWDFGATDR